MTPDGRKSFNIVPVALPETKSKYASHQIPDPGGPHHLGSFIFYPCISWHFNHMLRRLLQLSKFLHESEGFPMKLLLTAFDPFGGDKSQSGPGSRKGWSLKKSET